MTTPSGADELWATSTPHLIALAGHVVNRQWHRIAETHGVSAAGANAMLMLKDGPAVHREVARRCHVHPSTMTGTVDTLVRRGLVSRSRSADDRRRVLLALTPTGTTVVRDLGAHIHERFAALERPGDERVEIVRRFLLTTVLADADREDLR